MGPVKLKNGSEEMDFLVAATMMALKRLLNSGIPELLQFYDLVMVCKDRTYSITSNNSNELQSAGLLESNGLPHESIKNIVLSAVTGTEMDFQLGSPLAT